MTAIVIIGVLFHLFAQYTSFKGLPTNKLRQIRLQNNPTTKPTENLLVEELQELQNGIVQFQESTFEALYEKKVKWVSSTNGGNDNGNKKDEASSTDAVDVVQSTSIEINSTNTKVDEKLAVEQPVSNLTTPAKETEIEKPTSTIPTPTVKPIEAPIVDPSPIVKADAVRLKDVPIKPIEPEIVKEDDDKIVLKAQQVISKSFLSMMNNEKELITTKTTAEDLKIKKVEPTPTVIPTPSVAPVAESKVAVPIKKPVEPKKMVPPPPQPNAEGVVADVGSFGGLFNFLKSDPTIVSSQKNLPTSPPAVARAFMPSTPTKKQIEVVIEEEEIIRPTTSESDRPMATKGLASVKQVATPAPSPVKKPNPTIVPKPAPTPIVATKSVTLPKIDTPIKTTPVASSAATPSVTSFNIGGLFDFMKPSGTSVTATSTSTPIVKPPVKALTPTITPAKPSEVKVSKTTEVASVVKTQSNTNTATASLFDFLKPQTKPKADIVAKPVPESTSTANAVKPPQVVATKVPPKKIDEAPKPKISGGLFNLFSSPSPSFKSSSPVPPPPPPVVKAEVKATPAKVTPSTPPKTQGGFLNLFTSPTSTTAVPKIPSPTPSPVVKPTPIIVPTVQPVAKASPVSTVKPTVSATVKVSPKISAKPTPTSPTQGLFGFLNPQTSSPKQTSTPTIAATPKLPTPAIATKPTVTPAVKVFPKIPAAAKPSSESKSFLSFLSPQGATPKSTPPTSTLIATPKPVLIPKPTPVTPAKASPAPVVKISPKISSPSTSSGAFGLFSPKPVTPSSISKVPSSPVIKASPTPPPKITSAVAPAAPVPAASKSSQSGGFFGFLSPPSTTPTPIVSKNQATKVGTGTPSKPAASPVPKATATPTPPKSSGSLFGFSAPQAAKPSSTPIPPNPATVSKVVASKSSATPATPVAAAKAAVISSAVKAAPPPTKRVDSKPSAGFFGFLAPKPKVEPIEKTPQPAASSMNKQFQSNISKLLKNDQLKLSAFQKATDNYRSNIINAKAYVTALDSIFGTDPLDQVVNPLILELPEKVLSKKLQLEYQKFKASKIETNKKPSPTVDPKVIISTATSKTLSTPSFKSALTVPAKVPIVKKKFFEQQLEQLNAGTIDIKQFYDKVSKELGKSKIKDILPDLEATLPKDKGSKLAALIRRSH